MTTLKAEKDWRKKYIGNRTSQNNESVKLNINSRWG